MYGGFSSRLQKGKFVGSFPGNYSWVCRLDNLGTAVEEFHPEDMRYLSFYESSNFTDLSSNGLNSDTDVHSVPQRSWFEVPQSAVANAGKIANSIFTTQFVTGIKKFAAEESLKSEGINIEQAVDPFRRYYDNHCFLPAASHEKSKLLRIDFVSDLIVAYYGQENVESTSHTFAVGMAIYAIDFRSYSYIR